MPASPEYQEELRQWRRAHDMTLSLAERVAAARVSCARDFDEPGMKLFHMKIEATLGLTFDSFVVAENMDEAFESAAETICMTKHNDLEDKGSEEI